MKNKNKKVRILVVEDEQIVAMDIRSSLTTLGYEVIDIVSKGDEALAQSDKQRPDLVLMDINLKGSMDGIAAANVIKTKNNIPVVFLTAYSDTSTVKRAKVTDPFGYILKPFDERGLYITIEMALYRHTMETRLKESEEWFSTTLKSIGDAVIVTDIQGNVVFMNKVAEKLTGWSFKEAKDRPLLEFFKIVNEITGKPAVNPVEKVLQNGLTVGLANHTALITKNGVSIPIDDSASPIHDDNGNLTGVVMVFHDLSARKHYEESLKESETKYRKLFEANPNPMWVFEEDSRKFLAVNKAAISKYGYSRKEFLSMTINDIRPEEEESKLMEHLSKPRSVYERAGVWVHRKKDNELISVEVLSHMIQWSNKKARLVLTNDITDRLKAEQAVRISEEKLAASERWFRALVENSSEGIVIIDSIGTIQYSGPSTKRILGYQNEFLFKNIFTLVHPDDVDLAKQTLSNVLAQPGVPVQVQARVQHKNGKWTWIEGTAINLIHEPSVKGVAFNYRDITDRKLHEDEIKFQAMVLNRIGRAVIATDLDGNITYWNRFAEVLFGWERSEIIGKKSDSAISSIIPAELRNNFSKPDKNGGSWNGEFSATKKNGESFNARATVTPLYDQYKVLQGMVVIVRDVTQQRYMEQALQESERRLSTLMTNLPGMAYQCKNDTKWTMSFVSDGAQVLTGYASKSFIKNVERSYESIIKAEYREMVRDEVQKALKDNKPFQISYPIITKDGREVWVWDSGRGIHTKNGDIVAIEGFVMDINERRRNEELLKRRASQQAAIAELGQMALIDVNLNSLMNRGVELVSEILSIQFSTIFELQGDAKTLRLKASTGWDQSEVNTLRFMAGKSSHVGYTIKSGKPVLVADYDTEKRFTKTTTVKKYGIKSGISVVIQGLEGPYGVFSAHHTEPDAFSQDDINFLQSIANVLAVSVERKKIDEALRSSENRFERFVQSNVIGIMIISTKGEVFEANDAFLHFTGYSRNDLIERKIWWNKITPSEYASLDQKALKQLKNDGAFKPFEKEYIRKDGTRIPVLIGGAVLDEKDVVIAYVIDLTLQKKTEESLRETNETLEALIDATPLAVVAVDRNENVRIWNPAAERIFGWEKREVVGSPPPYLVNRQETDDPGLTVITALKTGEKFTDVELKRQTKSGNIIDVSLSAAPLTNDKNEVFGSVAVVADITERKIAEKKIHSLAFYDQLTKLPNRTLFRNRLSYAISEGHRNKLKVALLNIDLDRFKNINDSLGHKAGDQLLKIVAKRLSDSIRETDTVSRLGGDEFAIILPNLQRSEDASIVVKKVMDCLSKPIRLDKHVIFITPSIGISVYPDDTQSEEDLIMYADVAMYSAKRDGRNRFRYYATGMNTKVFERLVLDNHLRQAVEREEFELYYQPKVNQVSGKITSMEALIRWNHPELGMVSPVVFIPAAEEMGLMDTLGEWILRTACRQLKEWHQNGWPELTMAVNLSAQQFRQRLTDLIRSVLKDTDLDPQYLELEITESSIMESNEMVLSMLFEMRAMGVRIAIDDFGTGYSSLSRLSVLPVDTLKIDQTFIRGSDEDENAHAIVKAIIAIAKSMNLKVVAEGVETKKQSNFLMNEGCDDIQGYLISPPVPHKEFVGLLNKSFTQNVKMRSVSSSLTRTTAKQTK